jgi:hypothetical protein
MAAKYNTGVSGGLRQAGNNVALSRTLLSVGTIYRAAVRRRRVRREVADIEQRSSAPRWLALARRYSCGGK